MAAAASDGPVESHSWRGLVAVAAAVAVMATAPLWIERGGNGSPARPTVLDAAVDRPTTTTASPARPGGAGSTATTRPAPVAVTTSTSAGGPARSAPPAELLGGTEQAPATGDEPDGADPATDGTATAGPTTPAAPTGPGTAPGTTPAPTTPGATVAATTDPTAGASATTPAPPASTAPPDPTVPVPTTPATVPPPPTGPPPPEPTTTTTAATTTTTAAPLPVVTFGVLCSPVGAVGITLAGTPAVCSLTNGEGRPNRDGRARWRHA